MKFYTKSGRQIHYYNEGNREIDLLFNECLKNYSIFTTYEKGKANYNYDNNPTYGQCCVTSMIFQDMFGGTIHKINYLFNETHYFNKLNGYYYDLTSDQFDIYNILVDYKNNEEVEREELNHVQILFDKYNILKNNILKNNILKNNEKEVNK